MTSSFWASVLVSFLSGLFLLRGSFVVVVVLSMILFYWYSFPSIWVIYTTRRPVCQVAVVLSPLEEGTSAYGRTSPQVNGRLRPFKRFVRCRPFLLEHGLAMTDDLGRSLAGMGGVHNG